MISMNSTVKLNRNVKYIFRPTNYVCRFKKGRTFTVTGMSCKKGVLYYSLNVNNVFINGEPMKIIIPKNSMNYFDVI